MRPTVAYRRQFLVCCVLAGWWPIAACTAITAAAASARGAVETAPLDIVALSQPAVLTITRKDIERGFVDLPRASSLELKGNGNFVVTTADAPYISVVRVHIAAAEAGRFVLSYRIFLSTHARAGVHPWPMGITPSVP